MLKIVLVFPQEVPNYTVFAFYKHTAIVVYPKLK